MSEAWTASNLKPILIAGPTASGKSALALALAERLGGVVINADSMQVYGELRILTARPSGSDEARAPHDLYGFVPASDAYSAGRFVRDAEAALARARARNLRPIFTGGTGLYFKALTEGLSPIPVIDAGVRAHWRSEADRVGAADLHGELSRRDPAMAARLRPSDPQRIVRALEVLDSSGRSLDDWQQQPGTPLIGDGEALRIVLKPDRSGLYARADARLDRMIADGALDEARALAEMNLDPDLPAIRALGVGPLIAASRGEMSIGEAIAETKTDTRHYIKRQETWLKRNMFAWNNVFEKEKESQIADILAFIQS